MISHSTSTQQSCGGCICGEWVSELHGFLNTRDEVLAHHEMISQWQYDSLLIFHLGQTPLKLVKSSLIISFYE